MLLPKPAFKIIEPIDRIGMRCYFCGSDKSVKYLVRVKESNDGLQTVCNKCMAIEKDRIVWIPLED